MKDKVKLVLFWVIQWTWGLIENIIGFLIFVVMVCTGHKPQKIGQMVYFEAGGKYWGGFNMGFVAVVNKEPLHSTLRHEHGHFIQTIYFGPLMLPLQLASAIRYWYRRLLKKFKPKKAAYLPDYDAWWFEGQATKLGDKYLLTKPLAKLRGKE